LIVLCIFVLNIIGHRKITHKPIFALCYGGIAAILFMNVFIGLFAFTGYASHLFGDKIVKGRNKR
ncbi:MAG: hypothetical protein QMC80_08130, partial [Thermoplasmatales archaeon]|nr:hypothetical protein [Thermoplasmatales archaeon]